jgi:NAD+--asparagine ADP-ribosyltransferase
MDKSKDTQLDLKQVEAFIAKQLGEAFPQLSIKSFYSYDKQGSTLVGVFTEKNGMVYGFAIAQGDTSPVLRRVG